MAIHIFRRHICLAALGITFGRAIRVMAFKALIDHFKLERPPSRILNPSSRKSKSMLDKESAFRGNKENRKTGSTPRDPLLSLLEICNILLDDFCCKILWEFHTLTHRLFHFSRADMALKILEPFVRPEPGVRIPVVFLGEVLLKKDGIWS